MGGKSTIGRLPPAIKEAVDTAIREGRATIDEIVDVIRSMGGDASRSSVARYKKSQEEEMELYRAVRETAAVWATRMEEDPNGDISKLTQQLVTTLAFKVAKEMAIEPDALARPMDVMLLSKSVESIARAQKTSLERELRLRKEITEQAAQLAEESVRKKGLSAAAAADLRREILGIAA
jgi:hypothetical protein